MKKISIIRTDILLAMLFLALFTFSSCKTESDEDRMRSDRGTTTDDYDKDMDKDDAADQYGSGNMMPGMHSAMRTMMDKMHAYKMTGDADYDFVMMMVPHHEASIEMSENYISSGNDQKLKDMLQNSIKKQKDDITEMKDWTIRQNTYPPKNINDNYKSKMDKVMGDMMNNMNMQGSDNADMDFVNMSISHHQAAIDLAKIEIEFGKDRRILQLANKILTDQQEELKMLQDSRTNVMNK